MRTNDVHYLSSNDSSWTPPAVITLDTETRVIQTYPEVQALRCWHVRADYRLGTRRLAGEHVEGGGTTAADLVRRIDKWARRWSEVWIYAHNLNFDLAVTKLPLLLAGRGWTTTDMAVDGASPWMILECDTTKLVITDSHSIWPTNLQEIGNALDIVKPPLPEGDDDQAWMGRCAADTLILHTALLTVMDWHDTNQLGRWALTGAATGWNTMRHLQSAKTSRKARTARERLGLPGVDPAAQPIVIDPDPAGLTHDRKAVYGGRRQTWRHGVLPSGVYHEVDFERAYQTVMANMALPRKRGRWFTSLPLDSRLIDDPVHHFGIIAECEIETDSPRWPCRIAVAPAALAPGAEREQTGIPQTATSRIFYPIGRFTTVLAGPDIAEARRLGCLRSVGPGQVHQLGRAIAPWAQWSLLAQDDPNTPAVVRMALKHHGRAVAGKWAQRQWTKTTIGLSTTYGWSYQDAYVHDTGARGAIIDMAGTKFLSTPDHDGDNAYPAILAWIESYTRVALGRAIDLLGAAAVVQCDTDGMITDTAMVLRHLGMGEAGIQQGSEADTGLNAALASVLSQTVPLRLRAKTRYRNLEIIGPQHITLDGKKRWSGVPGTAERQADGSFTAWTWPKLAWQMAHGDTRGYTRVIQTYRLASSYAPGWLLDNGTVAAPEARSAPGGGSQLVPWNETRYAASGARLAPGQPAVLAQLNEDDNGRLRTLGHHKRRTTPSDHHSRCRHCHRHTPHSHGHYLLYPPRHDQPATHHAG